MKCVLCRKKEDGMVKIKAGFPHGHICSDCLDSFPESIRMNIERFTVRQLGMLKKIIRRTDSKPWLECGDFGVTNSGVVLKGIEYPIQSLRSVGLNFHPKCIGKHPKTVSGIVTAVIQTRNPHFLIEEPLFHDDITVGYNINGKRISYRYSYETELLFQKIQECIDSGDGDLASRIDDYYKSVMNMKKYTESKNRYRQKKETDEGNHGNRDSNNHGWKKTDTDGKRTDTKRPLSEFDEAKQLFGVQMPYTSNEIKNRRNMLLKKFHPDNKDGSIEMCQKINTSYDLLQKFVSD